MSEAIRISQEETRQKVLGGQALLVCAYADDAKFARYKLEGAFCPAGAAWRAFQGSGYNILLQLKG
jgi:hypothetical protein